MSFEVDLVMELRSASEVDAMVAGRIHALELPEQPTFPAIVWQVIAHPREYAHDGPADLGRPTVQLSLWAGNGSGAAHDALDLAGRVRRALSGFTGPLGGGAIVAGLMLIDERDDVDADTRWVRKIQDWRTMRREED